MKDIANINPDKVIGGSPGIDNDDYVFDFNIKSKNYPKGSGIWVVLHPKDKPGYARSIYNEIIGKFRQGDFEVEKASVYAMISEGGRFVYPPLQKGSEVSFRVHLNLPDPTWNRDDIVIEKHFEKSLYPRADVNAGNITDFVSYMDGVLKSLKMRNSA